MNSAVGAGPSRPRERNDASMKEQPMDYLAAENAMNSRGICRFTARKALQIASKRETGAAVFFGSGQRCRIFCREGSFTLEFD